MADMGTTALELAIADFSLAVASLVLSEVGDLLASASIFTSDGRAPGKKERDSRTLQKKGAALLLQEALYRFRSSKKRARSFSKNNERILYNNGLYN